MKYRFTHLALENWRNFRSVDVELAERVFVVGPNASGKTNLLDAFRFLRDIAMPKGSLAGAVDDRGGMPHLRSLHAGQSSQVRVLVRLQIDAVDWEYELIISGTKKKPLRIVRERVVKNGAELFARPLPADIKDPRLLEQTHLEQLTQNAGYRELVDALAGIVSVHVVPQVAKSVLRSGDAALREAPGSDFIEQLARLPDKKQAGALRRIEKLLRIAVPKFSELKIQRDPGTGTPHLVAKYKHWRPTGSWQNELEFSDGTLRLIGMLWAILEGSDRPLLLEEPELSLHEAVVQQIPRIMARAAGQRDRQIIVSTHSARMLNERGIDPASVLVLRPTERETEVISAAADKSIVDAVKAKLPMGEVVNARTRPPGIEQMVLPLKDLAPQ